MDMQYLKAHTYYHDHLIGSVFLLIMYKCTRDTGPTVHSIMMVDR